jgi:hypothetical protein
VKIKIETPWLKSGVFDFTFVLLPSLISVAIVAYFSKQFDHQSGVPLWAWVLLVVGIDVAHVYSTLFRTYFHSGEFEENRTLLTLIPLMAWLAGVGLYSISALTFWRVLAYVAVFHFIRQQYGFMRLYARADKQTSFDRRISAAVIYLATLYPIVYWHSHEPRNFHWFIDGDFLLGLPESVSLAVGALYIAVAVIYFANEIRNAALKNQPLNVPKNAVVLGTMLSWYMGIVYFNGDMAFTLTNVVSHGIPYMALVWIYGEKQTRRADAPRVLGRFSYGVFFSRLSLPLFLGVLLLFAYVEEGLWAGFVWREHLEVFSFLGAQAQITSKETLMWLVPLLALPQATHYVLDGFIWKMKDSDANWQKVLFEKRVNET